jgi:hypothetical protein
MRNIFLFIVLFSISGFSQQIKLENSFFYTIVKNGVDQPKKIKFKIDEETIVKIKLTEHYKTTLSDKEFLHANKVNRKITSPLVAHLFAMVNNSIIRTSWQLKNKVSFDFIEDSVGEISVNDNNEIIVKFYFISKNDFGNEITSMSKYNDNTREVYISN